MTSYTVLRIVGTIISLNLVVGCASLEYHSDVPGQTYVAAGNDLISRFMPVIVSQYPEYSYNRIGRPDITEVGQEYRLGIDSEVAAVYYEKRFFETTRGSYTNLIYRVHFAQVPMSLLPFNLTAGKNVGLIFIVTLNDNQQPVLITMVHTCGCYLAMVPTDYLQEDALPEGWNTESQRVYGATLPGLLRIGHAPGNKKVVVVLKNGTHRVIHVDAGQIDDLKSQYGSISMVMKPASDLEALIPDNGQRSVSMFETTGPRKGYVRDSHKPFEFLFMSWWVMDRYVGVDKLYGTPEQDGPPFNTSLKPWARSDSDMRDFPRFLRYWGWRL